MWHSALFKAHPIRPKSWMREGGVQEGVGWEGAGRWTTTEETTKPRRMGRQKAEARGEGGGGQQPRIRQPIKPRRSRKHAARIRGGGGVLSLCMTVVV